MKKLILLVLAFVALFAMTGCNLFSSSSSSSKDKGGNGGELPAVETKKAIKNDILSALNATITDGTKVEADGEFHKTDNNKAVQITEGNDGKGNPTLVIITDNQYDNGMSKNIVSFNETEEKNPRFIKIQMTFYADGSVLRMTFEGDSLDKLTTEGEPETIKKDEIQEKLVDTVVEKAVSEETRKALADRVIELKEAIIDQLKSEGFKLKNGLYIKEYDDDEYGDIEKIRIIKSIYSLKLVHFNYDEIIKNNNNDSKRVLDMQASIIKLLKDNGYSTNNDSFVNLDEDLDDTTGFTLTLSFEFKAEGRLGVEAEGKLEKYDYSQNKWVIYTKHNDYFQDKSVKPHNQEFESIEEFIEWFGEEYEVIELFDEEAEKLQGLYNTIKADSSFGWVEKEDGNWDWNSNTNQISMEHYGIQISLKNNTWVYINLNDDNWNVDVWPYEKEFNNANEIIAFLKDLENLNTSVDEWGNQSIDYDKLEEFLENKGFKNHQFIATKGDNRVIIYNYNDETRISIHSETNRNWNLELNFETTKMTSNYYNNNNNNNNNYYNSNISKSEYINFLGALLTSDDVSPTKYGYQYDEEYDEEYYGY